MKMGHSVTNVIFCKTSKLDICLENIICTLKVLGIQVSKIMTFME